MALNPTKTLDALRELLLFVSEWDHTDTDEFVELFESLDNWLTGGGPYPEQWETLRKMMSELASTPKAKIMVGPEQRSRPEKKKKKG